MGYVRITVLSYKERNVLDENSKVKFSLSLEPAFQVIYWSICWLLFFSLLIVALETQTFNLILIFLTILVGILVFYGLGSTLRIKNNSLNLSYYRGIRNKYIPLNEVKKITFSAKREVSLCLNQDKVQNKFHLVVSQCFGKGHEVFVYDNLGCVIDN